MKNSLFSYLLVLILGIVSCQDYDRPIFIKNNHFQLTLPGFVKEEELAEDAILEYANRYRNFYVVAFILKDTVNADSLWYLTSNRISSILLNPKIDSSHESGYILSNISGNFKDEKEPLFYTQKLIYRRGNSLLLTIWTRGSERKKRYEDEMWKILNSFKPLP